MRVRLVREGQLCESQACAYGRLCESQGCAWGTVV